MSSIREQMERDLKHDPKKYNGFIPVSKRFKPVSVRPIKLSVRRFKKQTTQKIVNMRMEGMSVDDIALETKRKTYTIVEILDSMQ